MLTTIHPCRPLYDDYCYFGGFYNFYSSWVEVLALFCLTFHMLVSSMSNNNPPSWLQYVYLPIMYGLPLLWSWLPFRFHTYATTAGWCDVRLEDEYCKDFVYGYIMRFAVWYGPVYLMLFLCFLSTMIAVMIVHHRLREVVPEGETNAVRDRLRNEVMPLIGYPIVYLLLTVFSLANAIDIAVNPDITIPTLWYLHVLTSPFRGAFIAVVYVIDSRARRQIILGHQHLYAFFCACGWYKYCKGHNPETDPLIQRH